MPRAVNNTGRAPKSSKLTRSQVERFLAPVPEEWVFWNNDGRVFRNLKDLKEGLIGMSDQTFAYHCNEIKNDFSSWVSKIIGDGELARSLESATNREQAAKIVEDRYIFLSDAIKE
jgi:hypothetical protein